MINKTDNIREVAKEIKAKINCIDYLREQGFILHEDSTSYRTNSIVGGNNPTCLTVYKDTPERFSDWKAQVHGDVIDLCALCQFKGNTAMAFSELIKKTGINISADVNTSAFLQKQRELPDTINFWHEELLKNPELMDYLRKRLFNKDKADQTIKELKIGYSPKQDRLIFPYLKNGVPVYYVTRRNPKMDSRIANSKDNNITEKAYPKYRKAKTSDYGLQICWGLDTVYRKTPLIIAEGTLDAISFYQEGYAVISSMTGGFSVEQKKELLTVARNAVQQNRDIIIIFDNDQIKETNKTSVRETDSIPAGEKFTRDMAKLLFSYNIPFKVATTPDFGDVSEHYQARGELQSLIKNATNGLIYLALSFKGNEQGFQNFTQKACRHIDSLTMAMLFNYARNLEIFDEVWLKELEKICRKSPLETTVCAEIMEEHQIIFSEGSGFYEYQDNVWKLKTDTDIRAYITKAMGKFSTGNKSSSILKLLADKCNSHVEFNKKSLMCFNNGTLELDTGVLRKPRQSDYITVKADYDYIPEAKCPKWLNFLCEVTSGNEDKICLLQEIAGYCLFTENNLQKCAYLIGEGGNGKSVYLEIIEALFGSANISHVEMSQFTEQFNRIALKDSIINISTELKTNVRGAEAIFKKLTAGETIDGCLKYKNIVTFKPRAKLIMAANEFIVVNDPSFALERRMNFVRFNERYVDHEPKAVNEHRADPNLAEKLKKELSGIFNWLYKGYKRLKANNRFTITTESKEVLKEFKEAIDPVTAFINNYDFSSYTVLDSDHAYTLYTSWASLSGYKYPVTSITFKRRFKPAFLKANPDWEAYRTKKERGFRKRN